MRASSYLNRPQLTHETWDQDGFFKTGDIGELLDAQHVRVIDRCKSVFKLANGEWVAPENVEAHFVGSCRLVQQMFIHGTSSHDVVVAIAVPSKVGQTATEHDVLEELRACGAGSVRHFEIPVGVHLAHGEGFTEHNRMLTASGKVCRRMIHAAFDGVLRSLLLVGTQSQQNDADNEISAVLRVLSARLRDGSNLCKSKDADEGEGNDRVPGKATDKMVGAVVDESEGEVDWGWSSMTVLLMKAAIEREFNVKLHVDALMQAQGNITSIATLLCAAVARAAVGSVMVTPPGGGGIDWGEECALSPDILRRSGKLDPSQAPPGCSAHRGNLLTGATGFLGAAILSRLVERSLPDDAVVYCLVRCTAQESPRTRLITALADRDALSDTLRSHIDDGRVRAIAGDLSAASLGLSAADLTAVTGNMSLAIHCGAWVNHASGISNLACHKRRLCLGAGTGHVHGTGLLDAQE